MIYPVASLLGVTPNAAGLLLAIVLAVLLAGGLLLLARRRSTPFDLQPLSVNLVQAYQSRLPELERLFVSQPREAVAAAKLLVDDMFNRIGYPVRMENRERVRDLRRGHRRIADRYLRASDLKDDPTTEQLRLSLQAYLEIGRELLEEAMQQARSAATRRRRELA